MIRFAWRQMRVAAIATTALLAVLVALLALSRHAMTSYAHNSGLFSCTAAHGDCDQLISDFQSRYNIWIFLASAVTFAPVLAGLFWGAPLIAREVEQGTHRLAWSQSISRRRWLATRIGLYLIAAVAVGALLTWLLTWWYQPLARINSDGYSAIQPSVFEGRGTVLVAWMLFALALGTAAGAVIRHTVPAIGVALAGYAAARILLTVTRSHLLAPKTISTPLFGAFPLNGTGDWLLGSNPVDPTGHLVSPKALFEACPGSDKGPALKSCPALRGYHQIVSFQPLSRFWPLQGIESGILVAAAVLLLALATWWTVRRIS